MFPLVRPVMLSAIVVAALALGCSGRKDAASGRESDARALLAEASSTEFGCAEYLCKDTVAVAKAAGQDYEQLVEKALRKDAQALHMLFWMTAHAGYDAASSEGNSVVIGMLLTRLGDGAFAEALVREPVEVRKAVTEDIAYDRGLYDPYASEEYRAFRKEFPRTWAASASVEDRVEELVLSTRREVGRGQPDWEVAEIGLEAVPMLLKMLGDERKVWVRIGRSDGGLDSVRVEYLFADDEGRRNSVGQFALLCIYRIREPRSGTEEDFKAIWEPVMGEFTEGDGKVSEKTVKEVNAWYEGERKRKGHAE